MSIRKDSYNEYMSKRGSYAIVPNEIWEQKDLDHIAKVIWCYIVSRKSDWKSSRNNLAKNLGIHRDTITKHLKELESKNLLRKTVGSGRSWSFEILPPCEWATSPSGPDIQRATYEAITGPNFRPDPGHAIAHTQEARINKQADEFLSSQEARDVAPADACGVQGKANSSQTPGNDKVTPNSILISWRKLYPSGPGFLSGKKAAAALSDLFFNLKKYGFEGNDITNIQIIKLAFGPNPKPNLRAWIEDTDAQIELQRSTVFEPTIEIENASQSDDFSQLISPEAIQLYRQFKAQGKTPADFNGMSLIDYANMRAYADSFPIFATS